MMSSAFVKTSQVYESNSQAIQAQATPEKWIADDHDND